MSGQEIVIEDLHKKPAMVEALKGKKIEEVEEYDIYDIPGDRRYTDFIFDSKQNFKKKFLWMRYQCILVGKVPLKSDSIFHNFWSLKLKILRFAGSKYLNKGFELQEPTKLKVSTF